MTTYPVVVSTAESKSPRSLKQPGALQIELYQFYAFRYWSNQAMVFPQASLADSGR